MTLAAGIVGGLIALVLSVGFALLNGGERVRLDLGLVSLSAVPLTTVVFGAVLLGMGVMLLVGIRGDLRVRRILRERLAAEDREERIRIDKAQQDLFRPESEDQA